MEPCFRTILRVAMTLFVSRGISCLKSPFFSWVVSPQLPRKAFNFSFCVPRPCSFACSHARRRRPLASQVEPRYQKRMGIVLIAICASPVRIRPGANKNESIDCCGQYFFLLWAFVLSIGNIEIIQIRLHDILPFKTSVHKPSAFLIPVLQTPVIKNLFIVENNKGNQVVFEAFFECD